MLWRWRITKESRVHVLIDGECQDAPGEANKTVRPRFFKIIPFKSQSSDRLVICSFKEKVLLTSIPWWATASCTLDGPPPSWRGHTETNNHSVELTCVWTVGDTPQRDLLTAAPVQALSIWGTSLPAALQFLLWSPGGSSLVWCPDAVFLVQTEDGNGSF